jgi:hypothetical protein
MEPKRAGNPGRYLRVLNCASEQGLPLLTRGRECDWRTPGPASKNATGLEVIGEPRPAWRVSCPAAAPCFAAVAAISFFARMVDSRLAAIQSAAYREQMSKIT